LQDQIKSAANQLKAIFERELYRNRDLAIVYSFEIGFIHIYLNTIGRDNTISEENIDSTAAIQP